MNIEELTIGQVRQLQSMVSNHGDHKEAEHWQIGQAYFIRTVTHHLTGRLVGINRQELLIEDAAWIADDGRFSEAMKTGNFCEVEPYPDKIRVIVGRGSIIDAVPMMHDLPRIRK